MEPIHIFYKQLPVNEDNIFMAVITEKNEVENVKFKKNYWNMQWLGLSINQNIGSVLVSVTDIDWQNFLSNTIQKPLKEKNTLIYTLIPFKKKTAAVCPPIKLTFYNTTTKKLKILSSTIIFSTFKSLFLFENIFRLILCILQSFQQIRKS